MENIKYYDNIECTLTQSSKSNFIKQNSGIRFGLLGAVLFIDNNKFLHNMCQAQDNYTYSITWKELSSKTTIIFTGIEYTYNGVVYPNNQSQYDELINNPQIGNLLPISHSFVNENDVSLNVSIKSYTFNIANINNKDLAFDGIAFISEPYIQEYADLDCKLIEDQNKYVSLITYFNDTYDEDKKIWLLNQQERKLSFNVNHHFHFDEDTVYVGQLYENNLQDGIHIINNGATNKNLNTIYTIGGTTNLLIG